MTDSNPAEHEDRDRVAVAYGIPERMRDALMTGTTAEELRDQANRLRASFPELVGERTYRDQRGEYAQYYDEHGRRVCR